MPAPERGSPSRATAAREGFTPELELVICCVRRAFGHKIPARVPTDFQWDRFAQIALRQGLAPVVHVGLAGLGVRAPEDVQARLHAWHAMALLRTKAGLEPNLVRTLETLSSQGLSPIVLKGADLAYTAYPKAHYRTLADIDLLLEKDQIAAADQALRAAGYTAVSVDLGPGHQHLPPYMSPDGTFRIELHRRLIAERNPYLLDLDTVVARAQFRRLAGVDTRVLSRVDSLVHVCVHLAFGHRYEWYSLRTLVDILALTTAPSTDLDWHLLTETVRASRTAGAVYWLLRLSHELLGAPVPAMVLHRLAPAQPLRRLAELVLDSPYILDGRAPDGPGIAVLYDLVREVSLYGGCPITDQLGAVWRAVFPPPDAITHLPPETTRSRARYFAKLAQPRRLARGVVAVGRLLARLPQVA